MRKITAKSHANIALVKYWGKGDEAFRTPANSSVAITLDKIFTMTTVEFNSKLNKDDILILGDSFNSKEKERIIKHIDRIRKLSGIKVRVKIRTQNNFPKSAGAASSASGFASLTLSTSKAAGLNLNIQELSVLARQGSGSACRSIAGGISFWHKGIDSKTSYAEQIGYPEKWSLRVLLAYVGKFKQKEISTTEGMSRAITSPYYKVAISEAEKNAAKIKLALKDANWKLFGNIIEAETFRLHMLCMTSMPPVLYWETGTLEVFHLLLKLRKVGVDGFFTVDAGPHVHVVCKKFDSKRIMSELKKISAVSEVIECKVGPRAHVVNNHLF